LAGGSLPVPIEPPYLAVYFIIALTGIFPPRS
jgi:microcystin-dependent protein